MIALGLTEEQAKKVLDAVKDYVPKTQLAEVERERDGLKATVAERDTQLETLKKSSGDNEALQKQIADLQKTNEDQQKAHDAEIAQLRLDNAVEAAILAAGAKNVKAVRALMDADKLAENIKRQANKGFTDSLAGIVSRAVKATLQREIDRGKRDRPARHDLHTRLFLWHYWTQSKIFVASTSPAPLWEEHALLLSTSW